MNHRYIIGTGIRESEIIMMCLLGPAVLKRYPIGRQWPFDTWRFLQDRPKVIFDVGANVGMTSKYLRRFFPEARIHAFEPVTQTFASLQTNLSADKLISCHKLAIGAHEETLNIWTDSFSEKSTFASNSAGERTAESVQVSTLDIFTEKNSIDHIDILKIDTQGHELAVLQGAGNCLANGRINFIYVEVGFEKQDIETSYFPQVHEVLIDKNYSLCGFYELFRHGTTKSRLGFCNALYQFNGPSRRGRGVGC